MKPLKELINLSGQTAIVTGGAKGIGFGICCRLAEAGAAVLIADIDEGAAHGTVRDLTGKGWRATAIKTDVSNETDVEKMIAYCVERFGNLNILVNNAGIYPPVPLEQMTEAEFEKVIHVNLRSAFLTTKHAAEVMIPAGSGRIINITSIDAIHPSMVSLAHYDASKHGLWGFTKNSALELSRHKIWVNAIAPGGIQTPGVKAAQGSQKSAEDAVPKQQIDAFMAKIPMRRMGEPDEIAKVALFLASDMASYMTGSQIVVDGGVLLT